MFGLGRSTHHPQHRDAAGADEPDEQDGGHHQEDDVEPCGVVPGDALLHHHRPTMLRNQICGAEKDFDQIAGTDHGGVETSEQDKHHFCSVVLAVDVQNGKHEQVGIDECDDTTEADPAV